MDEKQKQAGAGHDMVLYREREDHTYGPVWTASLMAREYLDDFFEKQRHLLEGLDARLRSGAISPVGYHMERINLAEADLACRVRVSRRAVRRHCTPRGFARIRLELAARYAEVFGIPVAHLFLIPDPSLHLDLEKTSSPLVVYARPGREPS